MIERKSDERLLTNRYERFWQVVGQRMQTPAQSGAQNEGLRDLVHQQKSESFLDFARND
jgi:hypothetical protein